MRSIPTNFLKGSEVLGETLYTSKGHMLVKEGTLLTELLIKKINTNKIYTVYIHDEHCDNQINRIIDQSLRLQGIEIIRELFTLAAKNKDILVAHNKLSDYADDVLYETSTIRNQQIEYIDIKNLDDYLYSSSLNTAILSILIARQANVPRDMIKQIFFGAIYHDIGLAMIPPEVINKNSELTIDEKMMILMHPKKGHEFLKSKTYLSAYVKAITLQHHEHMDGSGYPNRKKHDEIHLYAHIVGIADIYDAMTSDKPYKMAVSPNEAIEYITSTAGSHFPLDITEIFAKKINPYPVGSLVLLSKNMHAVVDKVHDGFPLRPSVRIINKVAGKYEYIPLNLMENNSILIEKMIYSLE
ncbi:MAG: HD-GYP domain-containing protein [Acidaminobacteraceae bacterium]